MQENKTLFLPNLFLPQRLVKGKIYTAHSVALKKKEIDLEFSSINLFKENSLNTLFKMPENRYMIYKKTPFSFLNTYSFFLESYDTKAKSYLFSTRNRKQHAQSSFKESFVSKKEKTLGKGRLLSTFLRGSKFSINGNIGVVKKILKKRKIGKKKRRFVLQKAKFLLFRLPCYGWLTSLHRFSWKIKEKKVVRKRKGKFFKKRVYSFLKKNRSFQSIFQLKTRKKDIVHFLMR